MQSNNSSTAAVANMLTSKNWFRFATLVLTAIVTALVLMVSEPIRATKGDPRATLLVSEAVIHHGTVRLDSYPADALARYGSAIQSKNGHSYYYFPLGTSLLSVPAVAMANLIGWQMLDHEAPVQIAIVLIVTLLQLWLLYRIARLFVSAWTALALAALCVLGTTLMSTNATALWSHDFAVLFASVALLLALRTMRGQVPLAAFWLGTSLFLAYLCRPTMALLAPFVLLMLALDKERRIAALKTAIWLGAWLALFVAWSWIEFSQWLPDYYLPSRLDGGDFQIAAWSNLFSPSRGLFVYSPFLAVALVFAALHWRRSRNEWAILLVALAWPICHWLSISQFPHWWAGWSFGPRLMTDALPGLFVLLFQTVALTAPSARRVLVALLLVTGVFSIYVHSYQGLFNPYSMAWSATPNVDENPELIHDWAFPQFLHNETRHAERLALFDRTLVLSADSTDARFTGFSEPEAGLRWMTAGNADVQFPLGDTSQLEPRLLLGLDAPERQEVQVKVNGETVHNGTVLGHHALLKLTVDPSRLLTGNNRIELVLNGNADPASPRRLALRYVGIVLKPQ
ncbi:MAG: glycosyltransferase family 39 protein [Dokdonella sp.]